VPRVTWNHVNPSMKKSKMGATCQLRKDSKGARVLRLVLLKGLGKVMSRYLRASEFQSFDCLRLT
jgi:hypothetical protein